MEDNFLDTYLFRDRPCSGPLDFVKKSSAPEKAKALPNLSRTVNNWSRTTILT